MNLRIHNYTLQINSSLNKIISSIQLPEVRNFFLDKPSVTKLIKTVSLSAFHVLVIVVDSIESLGERA